MQFPPPENLPKAHYMLRRLISFVGQRKFEQRIRSIESRRAQDPIMGELISERHAIELELGRLQHMDMQGDTELWPDPETYEALSHALRFASMVYLVLTRLSPEAKERLRDRLRRSLSGESSLRSLEHEMLVVAALRTQGWDLSFTGLENGTRTNLLVRKGDFALEIACKTVSADHGRQIGRADFRQLFSTLATKLEAMPSDCWKNRFVHLNLPGKFSSDRNAIENYTDAVVCVMETGKAKPSSQQYRIDIKEIGPTWYTLKNNRDARIYIKTRLRTEQFHSFCIRTAESVFVFAASSEAPDQTLSCCLRQLKQTTAQFSGHRPGVLWLNIDDLESYEWNTLKESSEFQRLLRKYLKEAERQHLCSMAIGATGHIFPDRNPGWRPGPLLHFDNKESPLYDQRMSEIFV